MAQYPYQKASKYPDLAAVYRNCSGPGGLKLAEYMADAMDLQPGWKVLDVGTNRGYQTCFLAKEFGPFIAGIDPGRNAADILMMNAREWGVEDRVLALQLGVPDTKFAGESFDAVYCTTTLEMLRGMHGEQGYLEGVAEIYRVLRPGGVFGLGEPMHRDRPIPEEIYPYVTQGGRPAPWSVCFSTLDKTAALLQSAGFEILKAKEPCDGPLWWQEFVTYDPEVGDDKVVIERDQNRWVTFGCIIARKPARH